MRAFSCLFSLSFVLTIHLSACSPPPDPVDDGGVVGACKLPFVGDPNAPMEVSIIAIGPTLQQVGTIEEGADVSLMTPPQEGRVLFLGVRARNVNPCAVRLSGAVRDPVSKQINLDTRIINLQVTEDGYAQSDVTDIFTFANVPACPNHWSSQDLMDVPYEITVSLTDKDERKVTKVMQVVPRCNEPGHIEVCRCRCDSEYELGMDCSAFFDAGISDAEAIPVDAP
ncbi:MAG TPA: hypothetical protein PK156_19710 [Polyangium sp.]|nr:hypothetical protein [Polyangium sp.]